MTMEEDFGPEILGGDDPVDDPEVFTPCLDQIIYLLEKEIEPTPDSFLNAFIEIREYIKALAK